MESAATIQTCSVVAACCLTYRLYQSQLGSAFVCFAMESVLNFVGMDGGSLNDELERAIKQLTAGDIAGYLKSALQAVDWHLRRLEKAPPLGSELGDDAPSLQGEDARRAPPIHATCFQGISW